MRTTDDYHVKEVQSIFKRLYDQGDIYKGTYEGWYCTPCESFWTESQLVDGCCPDCGRPVKKAKEEAYFFNMQKYAVESSDGVTILADLVGHEALMDTMSDIIIDFSGAIIISVIGYISVKRKKNWLDAFLLKAKTDEKIDVYDENQVQIETVIK